ncbi:hypothetical protein, partial [Agrobacterium vitis]|uniref:hypothetical protein n=1 Tax=Agrobacterium vitis TaxID=373 RepID=UPI001AED9FE1
TQRDRQQGADFAHERLIGTCANMSLNPGKFQLPLAQNRGARQLLGERGWKSNVRPNSLS